MCTICFQRRGVDQFLPYHLCFAALATHDRLRIFMTMRDRTSQFERTPLTTNTYQLLHHFPRDRDSGAGQRKWCRSARLLLKQKEPGGALPLLLPRNFVQLDLWWEERCAEATGTR